MAWSIEYKNESEEQKMIPGPLLLLILLWIITILYPGLFLATDTLWAFSHHMILFLKVLFLFFVGRNTPGREPTWVPLSQLPSNYFSYPSFPAIPLKAFFLSNKSRWAQPPYTFTFRLYLSFCMFNELCFTFACV